MHFIKLLQTLKGMGFAFLILLFLEIPLFASLKGPGIIELLRNNRPATQTETTLGLLLFAAIAIIGAEAARPWIRDTLTLDETRLLAQQDSLASFNGKMMLLRDLVFTLLLPVLAYGASMLIPYLLVKEISARGFSAIPAQFWLVAGFYAVYILARKPILSFLSRLKRPVTSALPTYTIQGEEITLDLKRRRALAPSKRGFIGIGSEPCIVTIHFDELAEIRALSFIEAQAFVQNEIGPDLQLALRGTKELYRYLNGEIERPSVYGHWGSLGIVLLLSGAELFYLVSVANTDVEELLSAFQAYQISDGNQDFHLA